MKAKILILSLICFSAFGAKMQPIDRLRNVLLERRISFSMYDDFKKLKSIYSTYKTTMKERRCIRGIRRIINSPKCVKKGMGYNKQESCAQLQFAIKKYNYCNN